MTTRTPKEVVAADNYGLWNKKNYQLGEELIADQVNRVVDSKIREFWNPIQVPETSGEWG